MSLTFVGKKTLYFKIRSISILSQCITVQNWNRRGIFCRDFLTTLFSHLFRISTLRQVSIENKVNRIQLDFLVYYPLDFTNLVWIQPKGHSLNGMKRKVGVIILCYRSCMTFCYTFSKERKGDLKDLNFLFQDRIENPQKQS